jgi:hypothetical protein
VPGTLSLGVKQSEREADHLPPSSAEVKECMELYLHSSDTPSRRSAQLKHGDNFALPSRKQQSSPSKSLPTHHSCSFYYLIRRQIAFAVETASLIASWSIRFVVFPNLFRKMSVFFQIGHDRILPNPYLFVQICQIT